MIIKVENLVKRYGDLVALNHFNLEVKQGEILGLLGPNGSGKSTAINCMLSLLTYDKGEIKLFGQKMTTNRYDLKKRIGIVPQDLAVFDELTVYENIDYFCGLYVTNKKERKKLIEEAIETVELGEFRKFYPKQLSGGLKRRLNIACGIAHQPELIFLDEPTVAVDPQSRNKILESIQELNRKGATVVYTSHYMEEVEQICTNIVIMDHGEVIAEGDKESLKRMINTGERITIEIPNLSEKELQLILALPKIINYRYQERYLTLELAHDAQILSQLTHVLEENQIIFGEFYSEKPTLNDVFLAITGKELRD